MSILSAQNKEGVTKYHRQSAFRIVIEMFLNDNYQFIFNKFNKFNRNSINFLFALFKPSNIYKQHDIMLSGLQFYQCGKSIVKALCE